MPKGLVVFNTEIMEKEMKKKLRALMKEDNIDFLKAKLATILKKLDKASEREGNKRVAKNKNPLKVFNHSKKLQDVAKGIRRDLIKNITPSEKIIKSFLSNNRINHDFQKIIYTKSSFYVGDFYIPDKNIIIEVDGGYHEDTIQRVKDKQRTSELLKLGINKIVRIENKDVYKHAALLKLLKSVK